MREQSESDAGRYRAGNQAMKLLVIDNYDSFTYNLVQLFGEMEDVDLVVKRNDEASIEEIKTLKPDRICISLLRTPEGYSTEGRAKTNEESLMSRLNLLLSPEQSSTCGRNFLDHMCSHAPGGSDRVHKE